MDKHELEVYRALRNLGIPPHLRGYEFTKTAMKLIHKDSQTIFSMTKLYEDVANVHGTTASKIERGIRHAISKVRADDAGQYQVLGRTGHLSNSQFLATLNESILVKMAVEESGGK